jgi:hypothetical protein
MHGARHLDLGAVLVVGHLHRLGEPGAELEHPVGGRPPTATPPRPARASVNMPWAITPGSPMPVATRSDQWIGLKSPLAPA